MSAMLRPSRSGLVTIRYRRCTLLVQPDQNKIISCLEFRHFSILHGGKHRLPGQRPSPRQGCLRIGVSERMLPTDAAALITAGETLRAAAGSRFFDVEGAPCPPPARLCRTQTPAVRDSPGKPMWGGAPRRNPAIWHFYCFVRGGRWWPGTLAETKRLRSPALHHDERLNDQV
jgi:hypothetical protein